MSSSDKKVSFLTITTGNRILLPTIVADRTPALKSSKQGSSSNSSDQQIIPKPTTTKINFVQDNDNLIIKYCPDLKDKLVSVLKSSFQNEFKQEIAKDTIKSIDTMFSDTLPKTCLSILQKTEDKTIGEVEESLIATLHKALIELHSFGK